MFIPRNNGFGFRNKLVSKYKVDESIASVELPKGAEPVGGHPEPAAVAA